MQSKVFVKRQVGEIKNKNLNEKCKNFKSIDFFPARCII